MLLSGDNERAARAVAEEGGITDVTAEVLPADKVDVIKALQAQGKVVAMVGDVVRDNVLPTLVPREAPRRERRERGEKSA